MFFLRSRTRRKPGRRNGTDAGKRALNERGAATVLLALLIPVLFGALAIGLDYAKLVYERQNLSNALDAAALAASRELPVKLDAAETVAKKFAKDNDAQAEPAVSFWCIVASSGTAKTVAPGQIPYVCNPGTSVAGTKCNEVICAIPCTAGTGKTCNTITVADKKDVPFAFAPVIGIDKGNTGALSSTACKGGCGSLSPNPMNVVLVADRTSSMSTTNRNLMIGGIKSTLQTMTRELQYVALGTIHRSEPTAACITAPSPTFKDGPWIPVKFSNDYTIDPVTPGAIPSLDHSSQLVAGLDCMPRANLDTRTYLASPMKAAARYLLGKDPNNLGDLPVRATPEGVPLPVRNAIIFETDGRPTEADRSGSTSLDTPGDIGSSSGTTACNNLKEVAANAKAEGILVVTVAFGNASSNRCGSGELVRDALAAAASPDSAGRPSKADTDCYSDTARAIENNDGDNFFCAAEGAELGPIFVSAINGISPNSHLIRIPD